MTQFLSTRFHELDAMDLLFKNFFNQDSFFAPVVNTKINHPIDIWESETGLHLDVAGTGLTKEDIEIKIEEGDILKISYTKPQVEVDEKIKPIYNGISRKSFNLGLRIAPKFDLVKIDATMENGLLHIVVPFAEAALPRTIEIK
jgi:HSP20 family molecular chaperone IbpA